MDKLTYKDFKIGQKVTCVKFDDNDFWNQHLTVGKSYKIEDLDFHFFDKLCVLKVIMVKLVCLYLLNSFPKILNILGN
jgi:hypothetical protein